MNDYTNEPFDRKQAFVLYATFAGDVERTAHALGVSPVAVLRVADDENWHDRMRPILELKRSGRPGDLERACNRALNFAQAHKARLFLERVLNLLTNLSDAEVREYVLKAVLPKGKGAILEQIQIKIDTRPFADLASALEKAHALTYMALGDTASERVKASATDSGNGPAVSDMHARIAAAMQTVGDSTGTRALLFDAQLAEAAKHQAEAAKHQAEAAKPENPADNDDH